MPAGRSRSRPCLATALRDAPDKVRDKRGGCSAGLRAGKGGEGVFSPAGGANSTVNLLFML